MGLKQRILRHSSVLIRKTEQFIHISWKRLKKPYLQKKKKKVRKIPKIRQKAAIFHYFSAIGSVLTN
jgi:hypothetical protein